MIDSASAPERVEIHVDIQDPSRRPVDVLCESSGLSRGQVKQAMTNGAAWVTRGRHTTRVRRASSRLKAGDELHLYFDPRIQSEQPREPKLVHDARDYSVWDKPYGLRSQGSKWGDHCTVVRQAEVRLRRDAFTVHRLDRAATGLIVVAHSRQAAAALSGQFKDRTVRKRYRVKVRGRFPDEPQRCDEALDGKPAASEFRRLAGDDDESLVDVRIETGRKHQVRRHLSMLGFPVIGDRLYGNGESDGEDLQLTAVELGFRHPASGAQVDYRIET